MSEQRHVSIEDYNQLINDGEDMQNDAEELEREINSIYETIDELEKTWSGESAEKYAKEIRSYKDDLLKFKKLVKGHGELVNAVGKDYKNLEETL